MTVDEDFDIPATGAIFTFGKSRFAENVPSKFWIKNDIICNVACGDEHTAVVTGSGGVFTIGNNSNGQLGLGNRKAVAKPSRVKALKPQRVVQIACGRAHTLAATEIGSVFAWGHNSDGQLGTGNREDKETPSEILKLPSAPIQLAAGSCHSMLLTDKGEILVWGSNKEGQLGLEQEFLLSPSPLQMGNKIASISCGYYHSLAVTVDGQLVTWGETQHGKLGLPKNLLIYQKHPQPVNLEEKVTMAVAGTDHSLVLTESGYLLSCGSGSSGQLGQGGMSLEQHTFSHVWEGEDLRFVYISAGDNHSAAISEDGLLYTWGCGRHGKLCLGEQNFSSQFSPILVNRLRHLTAVQVECGGCHTMVLGYRRSEMARKVSAGSALVKEVQILKERKELVLPTVPSGDFNNSRIQEQEANMQESLPLQKDNFLLEEEEDGRRRRRSLESCDVMEESQKKASRFARFWSSFIRRETVTTPYRSEEQSAEPPRHLGGLAPLLVHPADPDTQNEKVTREEEEVDEIIADKVVEDVPKEEEEEDKGEESEAGKKEETVQLEEELSQRWIEGSPKTKLRDAIRSRACVLV